MEQVNPPQTVLLPLSAYSDKFNNCTAYPQEYEVESAAADTKVKELVERQKTHRNKAKPGESDVTNAKTSLQFFLPSFWNSSNTVYLFASENIILIMII